MNGTVLDGPATRLHAVQALQRVQLTAGSADCRIAPRRQRSAARLTGRPCGRLIGGELCRRWCCSWAETAAHQRLPRPGSAQTQPGESFTLDGEVLFVEGASGVLDEKRRHGAPPVQVVAQFVVVAVRRQIPGREVPWWARVNVSVIAASTRSWSAGRRFDPGPHKCHRTRTTILVARTVGRFTALQSRHWS